MVEATDARSIGAAVRRGCELLRRAGCETPQLDAELLLAEVLAVGRERLVIDADRVLEPDEWAGFQGLLGRRVAREPVAYILGRREFRRLTLAVDPRVLIPRPETELLVEVGSELGSGVRVLDVGTGSGAVALALKDERPDLSVRGSDLSADALAVARANAGRLGLEVEFVEADLLDGIADVRDAVLANLPYVALGSPLEPEIARYEPPRALYGGADGLDLVRRLIGAAGGVALLALEIDPAQAASVARMLAGAGMRDVEVRRDLAGHDRVVVGRA